MENRTRGKPSASVAAERSRKKKQIAENNPHNVSRRDQYRTDPSYRENVKAAARSHYRKENPLKQTRLANGLLTEGTQREVMAEDMDHPVMVEAFTLPEAAKALGKAELTFKRWIYEEVVPGPVLHDSYRNYRVYSVGELQLIARIIAVHEREFAYLSRQHTTVVEQLHQALHGYRAQYV